MEFIIEAFIATCVILITLVLFWKLLSGKVKRNAVLIVGLCESGKTNLFARLCYQKHVVSVTSLKPSAAYYCSGKKRLMIWDIPGHERIRYSFIDKIKASAKGLVFIIDSSTIQKDIRDVAEFLYTLLCDADLVSGLKKILIVCNKQDLPLAKSSMNLLRVTKTSQLQAIGKGFNSNYFLGIQGKDFEFTDLSHFKLHFIEAVIGEEGNISEIEKWLEQVV